MDINSDTIKIVSQVYMRKNPDQIWYWDYIRSINKDEGDKLLNYFMDALNMHSGEKTLHFTNELFLFTSIYNNFEEYYSNKKLRNTKFPDLESESDKLIEYCEINGIIWDFPTTFIEHMYSPSEKVHTPRPIGYKISVDV
jgi:hypothetical protein